MYDVCVRVPVCVCMSLLWEFPAPCSSFFAWRAAPPAADVLAAPITVAAFVFPIRLNTVGQWQGVTGSHLTPTGRVWGVGGSFLVTWQDVKKLLEALASVKLETRPAPAKAAD